MDEPTPCGRVVRLCRYPLKSAGGEDLREVEVSAAGLADDRRWALVGQDGAPVTAKQVPGLRQVRARVDRGELVADPPLPTLVPGLVHVVDAPGEHQQVAAVHLVSLHAAAAADAPHGCDPEPRANVVLELARPGAEREWVGRVVRVGAVRLQVTRTPSSCLGVYAQVLSPGKVRLGDVATLEE